MCWHFYLAVIWIWEGLLLAGMNLLPINTLRYRAIIVPLESLMFPFCSRLDTFNGMSASEELDDSQVRQMLFDLDSAYNGFNRLLHDH